jgi:hypothetical protein
MPIRFALILLAVSVFSREMPAQTVPSSALRFEVSFPASMSSAPLDGHLILLIAASEKTEPRFQLSMQPDTAQAFGVDVERLAPGATARVDSTTVGYPLQTLADLPAGDYQVQAVLNIYEPFHLATGYTVMLPPDRGEGQHWQTKPGNLYSEPQKVHLDPRSGGVVRLSLGRRIPRLEDEAAAVDSANDWYDVTEPTDLQDTAYLKHVRLRSERLSKFWGRDMFLSSVVLLPAGWAEHPEAHYPLVVEVDHFHRHFFLPASFRATPPTPEMKGYERTYAEYGYKFYQDWTAGRLPRAIMMTVLHPTPYYDDSYAVNSANMGPYGDAITQELIPYVEKTYRAIGEGWARVIFGGSTGGWEALAQQVFYPDYWNGAWVNCPDPVDFRAYQLVNLYDDKNAYFTEGPFAQVPRGAERTVEDQMVITMEQANRYEYVLGTKGRSGEQFDVWQASFSPAGEDGYPKPIFDKRTGTIDHQVAEYWKQNYDLRFILERDWKTLGPKLTGKLHFAVGEMDSYYLNNAVRLMQTFLESTNNPYYHGTFDFGPHQPHCYSGNPEESTRITRLTIPQRFLPKMIEQMEKTAPAGADLKSWKY